MAHPDRVGHRRPVHGGEPVSEDIELLRAMIDGDPSLRATLQEMLGMIPWPYDDLVLRCPHCPRCGARAHMMVGQFLQPMAFCPDDECAISNWDPSVPAERLLATAQVMVEQPMPDGKGTVSTPHDPLCALVVPHPDDVTPTCTCRAGERR